MGNNDSTAIILTGTIVVIFALLFIAATMPSVTDIDGNVTIDGDLNVTGDVIIDGELDVFITGYGTDYGIILSMDFEENTGSSTYDQSPYPNHGTITGASWNTSKYGIALTYDGNDYVLVNDSSSLDQTANLTIEAWIKDPPILFGADAGGDFNITDNRVWVDDSRVYLSADPHTLGSSGWVEFTLISKLFSGDIDVVWGFNQSITKPSSPQVWANYSHTLYRFVLEERTFVNETHSIDYNATVKEYYEEWFFDWKPLTLDFTKILRDAKGQDTWYLLKELNVVSGREYKIRVYVDVPFSGMNTIQGKYVWGLKLSSDTLQQAVSNDRFYLIDPWWDSGWDNCIKLTVDSGDIDAVLIDWPIPVFINSSHVNWDDVLDNLDDFRFADSTNITLFAYDIESYNTNVNATVWVQLPTTSNVVDTVFFLYYGNVGAQPGEDKEGTWNASYRMVQHMVDETTSTTLDSTQYGYDGTKQGVDAPLGIYDGQINGAQSFNGTSYMLTTTMGNFGSADMNGPISIELWFNITETATKKVIGMIAVGSNTAIAIETNQPTQDKIRYYSRDEDGFRLSADLTNTFDFTGTGWHHLVITADGPTNTLVFYIDGISRGITYVYQGTPDNYADFQFPLCVAGWNLFGTPGDFATIDLDELIVYNTTLTAPWVKASYEAGRDDLLTYGSVEELAYTKVIVEKPGSYGLFIDGTSTLVGEINSTTCTYDIPVITDWHYVAMTYNSSYINLYVDGELVNSTVCTGTVNVGDSNLVIGNRFLGEIDQARIYSVAKTVDEIFQHHLNSGRSYSKSVTISDDWRILNTTFDEQVSVNESGIDMNQLYVLNSPIMYEYIFHADDGATNVEIAHTTAGLFQQDLVFGKSMLHVDTAPGGGKWFNASISNGVDSLEFAISGAATSATDLTGFTWDVSAQSLIIKYSQTAGGASVVGYIHGLRWFTATP